MGFPCHLYDPTQSKGRKEENAGTPSTAGWIPQGGGRPLLWRFFPQFLIAEKLGPAPARPPGGQAYTVHIMAAPIDKHNILCFPRFQNFFQKRC